MYGAYVILINNMIGRAEASPPSRVFIIIIVQLTFDNAHARATGNRAQTPPTKAGGTSSDFLVVLTQRE